MKVAHAARRPLSSVFTFSTARRSIQTRSYRPSDKFKSTLAFAAAAAAGLGVTLCEAAKVDEGKLDQVSAGGRRIPKSRFIPTQKYCLLEIEGWKVYVSPDVLAPPLGNANEQYQRVGREAIRLLQWQVVTGGSGS